MGHSLRNLNNTPHECCFSKPSLWSDSNPCDDLVKSASEAKMIVMFEAKQKWHTIPFVQVFATKTCSLWCATQYDTAVKTMMYKALEGAPNGKNRIALAMGHQTIRAKQEEQVGRNQSGEDVHRGACHLTSKTSNGIHGDFL